VLSFNEQLKKMGHQIFVTNFRQKFIILSFVLMLFTIPSQASESDNTLDICLVNLEYWAEKKDEKYVGIYPQIFEAFIKKLHITDYRFSIAPYIRLLHLLESGSCDISISLADNSFDINKGVLIWQINSTIVLGPEQKAKKLADLKGLHIGLIRGAKTGTSFDNLEGIRYLKANNFYQLVKLLGAKRIDAIAGDFQLITLIADQENIALGEVISIDKSPLPLNFILSNKSKFKDEFDKFNTAFTDMVNSGEIQRIILNAFGKADKN